MVEFNPYFRLNKNMCTLRDFNKIFNHRLNSVDQNNSFVLFAQPMIESDDVFLALAN